MHFSLLHLSTRFIILILLSLLKIVVTIVAVDLLVVFFSLYYLSVTAFSPVEKAMDYFFDRGG